MKQIKIIAFFLMLLPLAASAQEERIDTVIPKFLSKRRIGVWHLCALAKITVQNTQITVIKQNEDDYISLTDMLKAKDGEFFFSNWLRNRNTIEFLGIWERLMNPNLIVPNST